MLHFQIDVEGANNIRLQAGSRGGQLAYQRLAIHSGEQSQSAQRMRLGLFFDLAKASTFGLDLKNGCD